MIGRILKLEPDDEEAATPRRSRLLTWILLFLAIAFVDTAIVLLILKLLPFPHANTDYVIAGGVATMISLLTLFGVLLASRLQIRDPFFRRRPK